MLRRMTLLTALLVPVLAGCRPRTDAMAAPSSATAVLPSVEVAKAIEEEMETRVEITGTLAPWAESVVAFEAEGSITEVMVDLGDRVRRGAVLARVSPKEYELRKAQAEADLAAAQADQQRLTKLAAKEMTTKQQLDEANRRLEVARVAADLARKKLADTAVRAPFEGMVARRYVNAGEYVRLGNPAFQIVRTTPLKLKGDVPERHASEVRVGSVVAATSESLPGRTLSGTVSRIGPSVAVDTRSFPIEAKVENPEGAVKPGTFARASILTASKTRGVAVPEAALVHFAGNPRVFVIVDGKARERVVEPGAKAGGRVLLRRGVSAGELVVITGTNLLADGTAVAVR